MYPELDSAKAKILYPNLHGLFGIYYIASLLPVYLTIDSSIVTFSPST